MEFFRTLVDIQKPAFEINYNSKLMFLGSCFTENIGNKFADLFFDFDINPFGILYNPKSIFNSLNILLKKDFLTDENLIFYNESWFSFFHNSKFSNTNKTDCLQNINSRIEKSSDFLKQTDYLFLTFGTSFIYNLISNGQTVSNCHKYPAKEFEKKQLTVENIFDDYLNLIQNLKKHNPNIKIIFTVSPIRHWKDGAIENQLSKSILFVAIHKILNQFNNVFYFPSYEIQMDELRDYRFYSEDMLHPSQVAVNYIWKRFSETYFSAESKLLISEIEKLNQAKNHRPFNSKSDNYLSFLKSNIEKIEQLSKKNKNLKLDNLKNHFSELVDNL